MDRLSRSTLAGLARGGHRGLGDDGTTRSRGPARHTPGANPAVAPVTPRIDRASLSVDLTRVSREISPPGRF